MTEHLVTVAPTVGDNVWCWYCSCGAGNNTRSAVSATEGHIGAHKTAVAQAKAHLAEVHRNRKETE